MGLARHANIPTVVVGDIDRGGVFAAMFGTVALLAPADQALIAGFVVNKFRGDASLLAPGLDELSRAHRAAGVRRAAVAPRRCGWTPRTRSTCEGRRVRRRRAQGGRGPAAADQQLHRRRRARPRARPRRRLRRPTRARSPTPTSSCCPGPARPSPTWTGCGRAGSTGPSSTHAAAGRPVLGICGGCQMLGRAIADPRRRRGRGPGRRSTGWGCSTSTPTFRGEKVLRRAPSRRATRSTTAGWSRSTLPAGAGTRDDGARQPGGRRDPGALPRATRSAWTSKASFPAARERRLDLLGDLVEEHLDVDALLDLATHGAPRSLPVLPPGADR